MKNKTKNSARKPITAILFAAVMIASVLAVVPPATAFVCSRTYTLDADFDEGTLVGVEHDTVHDQLQLNKTATTLPFIWVPNSNEGTVSKVDTVTGKELGRYWTGPTSSGNPSRTTVDLQGNCWVGNRNTGTVVKIGLSENGQCVDKNGDWFINTSHDANGDGNIDSTEMLSWTDEECILCEVLLGHSGSGPRGLAIDSSNNLWAGTNAERKYRYVNGSTGAIIKTLNVPSNHKPYGAVIDGNGILWSSGQDKKTILKLDPTTGTMSTLDMGHFVYGLGIDASNHLFVSGWQDYRLSRIDVTTSGIDWTKYHSTMDGSRGVAVTTSDGDVWVANSDRGSVSRYDNNGNFKKEISVGSCPTGVAVDAVGKVWVCNYGDEYIKRIDPAGAGGTGAIDLSKRIIGGRHYSYSDMTGIVARTITTKTGTWTVDFDSEVADTPWGTVSWNSSEPTGTSITVKVRSSNDQSNWSAWETATNGVSLSSTPDGRYIQIETTLQIQSGDVSPILYDLTVECGNLPPVADAGPDQTVEQTYYQGANVTLNGSGSSDPDGDPLTYNWTWAGGSATGVSPTVSLPLGNTTITLVVNDGTVNSNPDTVNITVEDTTPPVITCPADVTVEQATAAGTVVPLNATATDICDASPIITSNELAIYPLGMTIVTFTATDDSGNNASCSMNVTVEDTTPPTVTITDPSDAAEIWYRETIDVEYTVSDICDASPTVAVTPSDPIAAPLTLGELNITVSATDASGNTGSDSVTVTVIGPKDLKEQAVPELEAAKTGDKKTDKKIDDAIKHIQKSLEDKLWVDELHLDKKHGKKVFDEEKKAVKDLTKLCKCKGIADMTLEYTGTSTVDLRAYDKDGTKIAEVLGATNGDTIFVDGTTLPKGKLGKETTVKIYDNATGTLIDTQKIHTSCSKPLDEEMTFGDLEVIEVSKIIDLQVAVCPTSDIIKKLVQADEGLAKTALDDAKATTVADPKKQDKVDKEIAKAEEELVKAEDELNKGKPDKAIDHYKKAWEHAQKAIKHAQK